jgi:Asp-tRNA(Asn)/Glu-tRNA(Gln) amidotransferase A subunit family amidase
VGVTKPSGYSAETFKMLTFFDAYQRFVDGADTPRAYLERCMAAIAEREPVVKAWAFLNEAGARSAADAADARFKSGRPLSPIDGMPIGIKDLIETKDMPTQMGCAAYAGNFPKRDNPCVRALRDAGAVVLGKTVTTELGLSHPGPTTNPFDPKRTPGGSSSGSAAAVGAGMVPATIGTQVGGSIMRPASYCGNYALKPTYGALNRGERQGMSQSVFGVHAGSVRDMWQVAWEIAVRAGGDPGHIGLLGPSVTPSTQKPARLAVMQTEGWPLVDQETRIAFEKLLKGLRKQGVTVIQREDHPLVEDFERALSGCKAMTNDINSFEVRWSTQNLYEQNPSGLSHRMQARLKSGQAISLDQYRARLQQRAGTRRALAALAPLCDAVISLSSPGPAPVWDPADETTPAPTGDYVFNAPSSALGAPAVNIPLLAVNGLPVGIQLLGQAQDDARIVGLAGWFSGAAASMIA